MYRYAVQGHYGGEWVNWSRERTLDEAIEYGALLAERWERVRVTALCTGTVECEWKFGEVRSH